MVFENERSNIMVEDEIIFYGHQNVLCTHKRTIEVTKDNYLSLRGDCIIGINANKGCYDLNEKLKRELIQNDTYIKCEIIVDNEKYEFHGFGNDRLTLLNKHELVLRKTEFICNRTAGVKCNSASSDLPSSLLSLLREGRKGFLRLSTE